MQCIETSAGVFGEHTKKRTERRTKNTRLLDTPLDDLSPSNLHVQRLQTSYGHRPVCGLHPVEPWVYRSSGQCTPVPIVYVQERLTHSVCLLKCVESTVESTL